MDVLTQTFGFVSAICAGIMLLTVFFTGLGYFKRAFHKTGVVAVNGFVRTEKRVNVHFRDGRVTPDLKFIGFTEASSANGAIPHPLSSMAVFESQPDARLLIRADTIKMIEELGPDA